MPLMDPQTFEWLKFGWGVLVTVGSIASAVLLLWLGKNFVTRKEYEEHWASHDTDAKKLKETLDTHSQRLTQIEAELKAAPKHADIDNLVGQISQLSSRMANMEGETRQSNRLLGAIHEYLLKVRE